MLHLFHNNASTDSRTANKRTLIPRYVIWVILQNQNVIKPNCIKCDKENKSAKTLNLSFLNMNTFNMTSPKRAVTFSKLFYSISWTSTCTRSKSQTKLLGSARCRAKISIWIWALKAILYFTKAFLKRYIVSLLNIYSMNSLSPPRLSFFLWSPPFQKLGLKRAPSLPLLTEWGEADTVTCLY